jgi:hypothetical protein
MIGLRCMKLKENREADTKELDQTQKCFSQRGCCTIY